MHSLEVAWFPDEPRPARWHTPVLALGNFDGLHRGHTKIIERVRRVAAERGSTSLVLTFDPHPPRIVRPDKAPPLLMTLQQKLEALESDRLDELPDITFARGLAAAICRAFGVDSAPVLARMPVAGHRLRTQESELNQSFRSAGDRPRSMLASGPSKPLMIVVGLLLVGAALLWLLPTLPIQLGAPSPTINGSGVRLVPIS